MKRYSLLMLCIIIILSGCEKRSISSIVDDVITDMQTMNAYPYQNNGKRIYSYYLPQDVGIKQSGTVSNILKIDNQDVLMSVDIASIINHSSSFSNIDENNYSYIKEFKLTNFKQEETNYRVIIEEIDKKYLVMLETMDMSYVTVVPLAGIEPMLERLVVIARTEDVDRDAVISRYSNKEVIDYKHEVKEFFTENIPESGYLNEVSGQKEVDFEGVEQDGPSN